MVLVYNYVKCEIIINDCLHSYRYPFDSKQSIIIPDWQLFIYETAKLILKEQSPQNMIAVRQKLYELLVHGIPTDIIFKVCDYLIIVFFFY